MSPNEDDDRKRGLRLSKALIMEAWSMCRPNPGSRKPRIDVPSLIEDMIKVRRLFGVDYLERLISGTKVIKYYKGVDDKTKSLPEEDEGT